MLAEGTVAYKWLCAGEEVFPAMLAAIDSARHSVCLETYIFAPGSLGERFRVALVGARRRGVRVRVLLDALGSYGLPSAYWDELRQAGGEVRLFNPLSLNRLGIRNHRKLLVCDDRIAFVGGFNIAPEYEGDGIKSGWSDVGLAITSPLAAELASTFQDMFERADFQHKRFIRLRKSGAKRAVYTEGEQLLLSGPGRGRSPIKASLRRDLGRAESVQIMVAYFLPTWRIRRQLFNLARSGRRVQLLLAGKSDVAVAQLAGQSLYGRFLRAGVQMFEYQPQILHAKLIIIDDVIYVGSANLDQRSLNINYELMIRLSGAGLAEKAREVFARNLGQARQITRETWRASGSLWRRFKQYWSYYLLVHIDPYIARRQWRALPD